MAEGIEKVNNRLERAANALSGVGLRYAVVGGNAVTAWVSRVDAAAVRNTRDVDILLRREEDRMHLRDLASVGSFDANRPAQFPAVLGKRLQAILDDPEVK
jgi:hypothetical protein